MRNEGRGVLLAKTISIIVVILAILSLLGSIYYGYLYWHAGIFDLPLKLNIVQSLMTHPHH
jgi:uncharacterized membrane protein AbrB (regulator of aidB expression)